MESTSRQNTPVFSTLLLALAAEAALFSTLVMSYVFLRTQGTGAPFSHFGSVDLLAASLNTLALLLSAACAWRAEQAIAAGSNGRLSLYLGLTLGLAALFVAGQIFEFSHSGLHIDQTIFGGAFFTLISFHIVHVLAGIIILALNLVRARLRDFTPTHHVAVTVGTWFWYFVAAVWVVLYILLYWV